MKRSLIAALFFVLSLAVSAKVVTDKSKGFQFEVPDYFTLGKGNAALSSYFSPDEKVVVSSVLLPSKNRKLIELVRDYSAAQERAGKVPQRGGSLKLGGKDAMAVVTKDAKGNSEMSFICLGDRGVAILILDFLVPIKADTTQFAQLVCRSFRWVK